MFGAGVRCSNTNPKYTNNYTIYEKNPNRGVFSHAVTKTQRILTGILTRGYKIAEILAEISVSSYEIFEKVLDSVSGLV